MSKSDIKRVPAKDNSTTVRIHFKGGKLALDGSARVLVKKNEKGYSCYITGLDIYFKAQDEKERAKKTLTFIKFYLDNFLMFSNKNGLRRLVLDLNKKGFRADNHNSVMLKLVNNQPVNAKFKPLRAIAPKDFADANEVNETFEIAA